jgi:hypothetical protein|tara:strand:- start:1783 stop:2358 length:576 start_codon:yes stop_codon:yes gene_type:complete
MDFSFAVALLSGQKEIRLNTNVKLRDPVIRHVLELFENQPVKIFQVGGIESLQTQFRWGSGWSDTIFGAYVKEFGGSLTVADIDLDHLANSSFMSERLGYNIDLRLGDAIQSISKDYDIYYLDGADGDLGDKQTLEQFKKIEDAECVVLIDDIQSKAVSIVKYLKSKNIKFDTHHGFGNGGMITIDMRQKQ